MSEYNHRSAGHEFDWNNMTENDAIRIVLDRLEDLYEVLNGEKPVRPNDLPAHHLMVKWTPILADYLMFAQRANHAIEQTDKMREEVYRIRSESYQEIDRARVKANKAIRTLQFFRESILNASAILAEEAKE